MKSAKTGADSTLGEAPDGRLFALMARRDEEGRNAFTEFHRRYIADFHRLVCKRRGLSDAAADDLVQETMLQAYLAAATFEARDDLDPAGRRRWVLGWLSRIAQNLYYGDFRKQKVTLVSSSETQVNSESASPPVSEETEISYAELQHRIHEAEDAVAGIPHAAEEQVSPERQLLRDALSTLGEREREIFLLSYEYRQPGEEHPHIPKAVIDELCDRYGITPAYMRKLRERARKQVLDYLQANSPAE